MIAEGAEIADEEGQGKTERYLRFKIGSEFVFVWSDCNPRSLSLMNGWDSSVKSIAIECIVPSTIRRAHKPKC